MWGFPATKGALENKGFLNFFSTFFADFKNNIIFALINRERTWK